MKRQATVYLKRNNSDIKHEVEVQTKSGYNLSYFWSRTKLVSAEGRTRAVLFPGQHDTADVIFRKKGNGYFYRGIKLCFSQVGKLLAVDHHGKSVKEYIEVLPDVISVKLEPAA